MKARGPRTMTRDRLDPRLLELVEPLRALVPPARLLAVTVLAAIDLGFRVACRPTPCAASAILPMTL